LGNSCLFPVDALNKKTDGDGIVCKGQKNFFKNINGRCERNAKNNLLISHALVNMKSLYIAALDCKDAFQSVSYQLLNINLNKLGVPILL
jgi:hypothetical protein